MLNFWFTPLSLFVLTMTPVVHSSGHLPYSAVYPARKPPAMFAHKGDKFLMPEHSIPAYDLAMLENVDFVEPDLVMTADGVLVCHHKLTLKQATDVAEREEFRSRMKTKTLVLDGQTVTLEDDWFVCDFTLAELKTLRLRQEKKGIRPQYFNDLFTIPTFQEFIDLVHKDTWRRMHGKHWDNYFVTGMTPELKHVEIHNEHCFQKERFMEDTFIEVLRSNGYLDNNCKHEGSKIPCSPLIVQIATVNVLSYIREMTNVPTLLFLDGVNLRYLTLRGMLELRGMTEYIGLWKEVLFVDAETEFKSEGYTWDEAEINSLGGFIGPTEIVKYAHGLGIKVLVYTIYHSQEDSLRGCAIKCVDDTKEQELKYFFDLDVDGLFIEGICESLRIRDKYYGSSYLELGWTPLAYLG